FAPPPACGRPSPSGFTSQPVAIQDKLQFCKAFSLPKLKLQILMFIAAGLQIRQNILGVKDVQAANDKDV
ncbi:MAG: hypothetical protein IKH88_12980, partial [Prevotella sp.]|nr:hypothetical protein [Prevotella sp.]